MDDGEYTFEYEKDNKIETTVEYNKISNQLKQKKYEIVVKSMMESTWQGLLLKERLNDIHLNLNECFTWASMWKESPVEAINDIQSIYLQIVPTLTFKKFRGENIISTKCRLCKKENESVRHIMSHCEKFLPTFYKKRHDKVLQYILFVFLKKYKVIDEIPPWFTKIMIKTKYENDEIILLWDVPEYEGREDEQDENLLRPDGKIVMKHEKKMYVLEQSVPWISNRESKEIEKVEKYRNIIRSLKLKHPGYEVDQLTFIIDCLGGYSNSLNENLRKLKFTKAEENIILNGIQKIVICEARSLINQFKIITSL